MNIKPDSRVSLCTFYSSYTDMYAEYCIPCVQLAYRFRMSSDREECKREWQDVHTETLHSTCAVFVYRPCQTINFVVA